MENNGPAGSQEVKDERDGEKQVDEDVGLLMSSEEGDATKGEEPIGTPAGMLVYRNTGDTVASYRDMK